MEGTTDSGKAGSKFGKPKHHQWVEIISAALLALATVASAWSAYQAARWNGIDASLYAEANATRIHASEAADLAAQQMTVDAGLFSDYSYAYFEGNLALAEFYESRLFRAEMRKAVEAWKATSPLRNPSAPKSPFEMEQYTNKNKERSRELERSAQKKTTEARAAIGRADRYILLTVLFASVLFFAGISTKFSSLRVKAFLLGFGWILFIGTFVTLVFQSVQ